MEEKDVIVTRPFAGLVHMQVCAHGEVPPERIEEVANLENPSGVTPWHIAEGPNLAPVPCSDDPVRLHYMLSC